MLTEKTLDRLCCPVCKHYPLEPRSIIKEGDRWVRGELICAPCVSTFPISHGIPNFMPKEIKSEEENWRVWSKRLRQFDRRIVGWTKEQMEHCIPIMEDLFYHFHPFKGVLLDIGCGDGKPRSFLKEETEYWGIDPGDWVTHPKHTFDVEALFPGIKRPFPFFLAVGEYLPFRSQTFDNVLFFSSFDHVQSPREVLRESFRVLKRGGSIVALLELSDSQSRIPRSRTENLRTSFQKGISKLSKRDFVGFVKGAVHTLTEKPDLFFTRKDIEELFGFFFLDLEIKDLPEGDAFVKARKP